MKKFTVPSSTDESQLILSSVIEDHHDDLFNEDVQVDLVFSDDVDSDGVLTGKGLTERGHPAYAVARLVSSKDRQLGRGDCEIEICGLKWDGLTEKERRALIDHECAHFQLAYTKDGDLKKDANGNVKLEIRKHDVEVGWFYDVADRNGEHSIERKQARDMVMGDSAECLLPGFEIKPKAAKNKAPKKREKPAEAAA